MDARRSRKRAGWLLLLFIIPFVVLLYPPFYNLTQPRPTGIPSFCWFQLAAIIGTAAITWFVLGGTCMPWAHGILRHAVHRKAALVLAPAQFALYATLVLGLLALLGYMALAARVTPPKAYGGRTIPTVKRPGWPAWPRWR